MKNKKRIYIFLAFILALLSACNYPIHNGEGKAIENEEEGKKLIEEVNKNDKIKNKEDIKNKELELEKKQEERKEIKVIATGDILMHMPVIDAGRLSKNQGEGFDFNSQYDGIRNFVKKADLAIINYEGTFARDIAEYASYPVFNGPDELVPALKNAGFHLITTGNNHSNDYGKAGLVSTMDTIINNGMEYVGTQFKKEEKILYKDIDGIKLAIISATEHFNGTETWLEEEDFENMLNPLGDGEELVENIKKARKEGADIIIIYPHWGEEYALEPNDYQRGLAQKMIDAGADLILGSHPHVPQEAKFFDIPNSNKKGFLIYSMGNTISNQRDETMYMYTDKSIYTEIGVLVDIDIVKENGDVRVDNVELNPTWVDKYYDNNGKIKFNILNTSDYLDVDRNNIEKDKLERILRSRELAFQVFKLDDPKK